MKKLLSGRRKKRGLKLASSASTDETKSRYRYAVQEYGNTVPHDYNDEGYLDPSLTAESTSRRSNEFDASASASPETAEAGQTKQQNVRSDELLTDSSINHNPNENVGQYQPPDPTKPYYRSTSRVAAEPEMVDTTYEERYGDAYTGSPIKYVYPAGYQSMRPRSGPWKLSIAVCVLFTWLSIFIVGHCSDRIENSQYANNDDIDDDALVIETRWCGSHMLYVLWVMSMTTTGLALAYCSVIGYIKVRDFSVANCRSQPPGMVGKSDYYVRIMDGSEGKRPPSPPGSEASYRSYQRTIYQADGTPRFWGSHIYRPTQAAVAVTSR